MKKLMTLLFGVATLVTLQAADVIFELTGETIPQGVTGVEQVDGFKGKALKVGTETEAKFTQALDVSNGFTITMWLNFDTKKVPGSYMNLTNLSEKNLLRVQGRNQLDYNFNTWHTVVITDAIAQNAWTNWTITYDGSTIKTYVNGKEVNSTTMDPTKTKVAPVNSTWELFARDGDGKFIGMVDELKIYNGVLSAEEIAKIGEVPKTEFDI